MLKLGELKPAEGSKFKKFIKGRGHGSGNGKTSGRGHNGQKSRSGYSKRAGFEGGQWPLYRRIPKRGFNNRNTKDIVAINIDRFNIFDDNAVIDIEAMVSSGLFSNPRDGVKILSNGELTKKLTIKANSFSKVAIEKIEAAGGKAEVI
jgi:large subunit ribosomal protein L15